MSNSSNANPASKPSQPSLGDKVVNGAAFALGAAGVAGALAFVASGFNPFVAIAVAGKVGTVAGLGHAAGESA
jgi:ABC-type uncharacterized transport system permease subunit